MKITALVLLLAATAFVTSPAFAMGSAPEPDKSIATQRPATPEGFTVTIEDAYRSALKTDENVGIRRATLERTFGDTMVSAGEVIGDVHFVYTDSRQDIDDSANTRTASGTLQSNNFKTRTERRFTFNQPVFQGFKEFGVIAGAGALRAQRVGELKREEEVLLMTVADSFYGVLQARRDVKTITEIRRLFDDRIKELGEREEIGRSRPSESSTALSRMRSLEAEYALSRGNLQVIETEFEHLTGVPARSNELDDAPVDLEVGSAPDFHEIAERRTDVAAAKGARDTAKSSIIIAQSELFPYADISGNLWERREGFQQDNDWDVLLTVELPLFTGGTNIGLLQQEVSDYKIAELQYRATRRGAVLDLERTRSQWLTALERSRALDAAVKAAEENFDYQKEEYTRSLVSNLDVLDALEQLLDTRRQANAAFYDMKRSYWRHRIARGDMPA